LKNSYSGSKGSSALDRHRKDLEADNPAVIAKPMRTAFRPKQKPPRLGGDFCRPVRPDHILSLVFFILAEDLDIFFLLILFFDMSLLLMLSLCATGPVVAGLFVSVD